MSQVKITMEMGECIKINPEILYNHHNLDRDRVRMLVVDSKIRQVIIIKHKITYRLIFN